jgi:tRNA threonylcarbamoyladenosine biosynthesis protein TsaE
MQAIQVNTAQEMERLGADLAKGITAPFIIYLYGELGAGKTTLVRGFIHQWGFSGRVKSPSYQLVESYEVAGQLLYHFDLYRLRDPKELLEIGLRDYLAQPAIFLFEWAEKAQDILPTADLCCYIDVLAEGRIVRLSSRGSRGTEPATNVWK